MVEVLTDVFGPGLQIVLEFRPDVLLVVEPNRRLIREPPFELIDLVEEVFLAQVRIHIEDFHRAALSFPPAPIVSWLATAGHPGDTASILQAGRVSVHLAKGNALHLDGPLLRGMTL
jgi:hypothetical protein